MIRFIISLLLFPFAISAQEKFSISGNIQGLPDGSSVSISNPNIPTDTLARTNVKQGAFELTGKIDEPNLYQLNFDGIQKKSILFIGNDNVKVNGSTEALQDIVVSGSAVHDDFERFKKTFNPLFQELTSLGQQMQIAASISKDDSLSTAYKNHLEKIKNAVDNFVRERPASPVAPFVVLVTSELEQDVPTLERRYNALDKKVQSGFYGNIVKQQIDNNKAGALGSIAPDFSQADVDGKQVALSSYKGKYVLIDFWASWCRPCREENPNVVKAYNKYKDRNFTVLGISLDKDRAPWLKAIKDDKLDWTQLSDLKFWNNEVAAKYKIQSIPQNFLIDPSGKIIAKNLRGRDLDKQLSELIK